MNIDWSKCPQATHFAPKPADDEMWCEVFWRVVDGVGVEAWSIVDDGLQHYSRPTWREATAERLIARPSHWNGEGLPPVGTICECHLPDELTNKYSWQEAKVIWHNGPTECAVIRSTSKLAWCDEFRPIRTAEQISEEAREKAISKIIDDSMGRCDIPGAAYLYDAGYRCIVEAKQ